MNRADEEGLLLHGHCHLFAAAMQELTGLPLGAWLDTDLETEATVLVHACVIDGDTGIDVRGRMPLAEMLDEFDAFEPEFVEISRQDLMQLGQGKPGISETDPALAAARERAANLLERLLNGAAGRPAL